MSDIWIVNDFLTCIPGTRTFWHLLLEIDGTLDKTGVSFPQLKVKIEDDQDKCDLIIRNATFFPRIQRKDCKQIALLQDYYGDDEAQSDVCEHADCVVFNSTFTRDKFSGRFPDAKTIPLGVNEHLFRPVANFKKEDYIFDRFKKTGIFVGDYNSTKNTAMFEALCKEKTYVDFIYISKLGGRINLPNVINYPGGVNEQGMVKLYSQADFCIFCSPVETLHLASVEACLCNIPVIGTNTGWLAHHFDEKVGIRVDNPTFENFCDAIDEVITSHYEPREYMLQTPFTWASCKNSWENLIKEVIEEDYRG